MLLAILQNTPVWVWGLLAALVAVGVSQSRDRTLSLTRVTVLPLVLLALSLSGVLSAFGHQPVGIVAWLVGVGTALTLARRAVAVRDAVWLPSEGMLRVPGSWLPMVLIVGLFLIKYVAGVMLAMAPGLANDTAVAGAFSLAYGGFSGLFLARALSLRSLATRAGGAQPA